MSRRPRQSSTRPRAARVRRAAVLAGLLVAVLVVDVDMLPGPVGDGQRTSHDRVVSMPQWALPGWAPATSRAVEPPAAPPATAPAAPPSAPSNLSIEAYLLGGGYPTSGPGTWRFAGTVGPVLGTAGRLRRYRVAVETGVPEDLAAFAAALDRTLGDPRSWIGGLRVRLQRVPPNAGAEFTVYLATPETTRRLCAAGGLDVRLRGMPYTSCRLFGRVILNLARWRESTPEYVRAGVPLEVYRQYLVNHEVGHQLGYRHELCPGPGRPAPVMQTQTLGLHGCTANPWPYLAGRRYAGRPA